jgi:Tfp pilus assembly protein PilF
MAVKKKAPLSKNGSMPQSVLHDGLLVRPAPGSQPRNESEKQLDTFSRAMKLFVKQQYAEAKPVFQEAAMGPQKEVSHNARAHMNMCDRRIGTPAVSLETLDDHYNYAIERLNARDMDVARKHLDCAMQMVRKGGDSSPDHLYYAMALCAGISGDTEAAFENLKQAIEMNPRNRVAARQDSDLAPILQQPRIQALLYPEKITGPF